MTTITITTKNKSSKFLQLINHLQAQGFTVTVTQDLKYKPMAQSNYSKLKKAVHELGIVMKADEVDTDLVFAKTSLIHVLTRAINSEYNLPQVNQQPLCHEQVDFTRIGQF